MGELVPQKEIPAGTPNAADLYNENVRAGNASDQALAEMFGGEPGPPPVLSVKIGTATFEPDPDTGLVVLPSGSSAQVLSTAARDALAGDDLYLGRLVYNTSVDRLQRYGTAGWTDAESYTTTEVFTASGTWKKPARLRAAFVTVIDGGKPGTSTGSFNGSGGGTGGAVGDRWIDAAALADSVAVTVAGPSGLSSFGSYVVSSTTDTFRSGGKGGTSGATIDSGQGDGFPGSAGATGNPTAAGGAPGQGGKYRSGQPNTQATDGAPGESVSGTRGTGGGGGGGGGKSDASGSGTSPANGGAGGAGGIPGGGGGGGGQGAPGGAGARGEVVVDMYF